MLIKLATTHIHIAEAIVNFI